MNYDYVQLPSGNTIDRDTWDAIKASDSDWREWLPEDMYPKIDRDFLDS